MLRSCIIVLLCLTSPGLGQDAIGDWLKSNELDQEALAKFEKLPIANRSLTRDQASAVAKQLWEARVRKLRQERGPEMDARVVELGEHKMPFWYKVFGDKPEGGRSLFISMHGGGGAPARVNDGQYENQKRLYEPKEGVYLVPRAPTNTWNLWHQAHIDDFFDRLITNMIVFEDVNPNRVYFMGYSAGGDGVYQLAPRMADRLAAASMMAGHPNETQPDGLRNIGFALFMGGKDAAYKRNQIAADWKKKLAALREADPDGYQHEVTIYPEFGHWMNRKDRVAVPWMAKFNRNPFPTKVVWKQDDVAHSRFYWLAVKDEDRKDRSRVVASVEKNEVRIEESDLEKLTVLLSDELVDLDKPVRIVAGDETLFEGKVERTAAHIASSLLLRDDPASVVSASVEVTVPKPAKVGKLLFSDDFEREILGRWKEIIPGFKVEDGMLIATQDREDHGSVGRVYLPMKDVEMSFRFRLAGSPRFNVVFDDKSYKGSHAGHICRVAVAPKQIRLGDDKEGIMRNDIFKMRRNGQKEEANKLIKGRQVSKKTNVEQNRWYLMRIKIAGDEMQVWLDDEPIDTLTSPGIAHPTKQSVHFTVNGKAAHFDDIEIREATVR